MWIVLFAFPCVLFAAEFNEYLKSSFHHGLAPDLDHAIADYYNDLANAVSDLSQLDVSLQFNRFDSNGKAVFIHRAAGNRYLKPWASPYIDNLYEGLEGHESITFTFQVKPGSDCSLFDVYGMFREPFRVVSIRDLQIRRNEDRIRLDLKRYDLLLHYGFGGSYYLSIPENCFLYISEIEKRINTNLKKQVEYSNRNNKPAELHGLVSREIQNLDPFRFIDQVKSFPAPKLQQYSEGQAEFTFESSTVIYAVPQHFFLGYRTRPSEEFDQDRVRLVFDKPDLSECQGQEIEISYDNKINQVIGIETLPNCTLQLIRIERNVSYPLNSKLNKKMRYGMANERAIAQTTLPMAWTTIYSPAFAVSYIETLSDIPELELKHLRFGTALFKSVAPPEDLILPMMTRLVLHTTSNAMLPPSTIKLTFQSRNPTCNSKLKRYLTTSNGETMAYPTSFKNNNAFSLKQRRDMIYITYRPFRLNALLDPDTIVSIMPSSSSCDFKFLRAAVSKKGDRVRAERTITLTPSGENENEQLGSTEARSTCD